MIRLSTGAQSHARQLLVLRRRLFISVDSDPPVSVVLFRLRGRGPIFIWSWPLVLTGQFLVALGFAELAAHYPLSGGAYQWSKLTGSPRTGFIVGWIYLACLVVTLSAVALALQALLPQVSSAFQVIGSAGDTHASAMNAVLLGCGLIVLTTTLNAVKVSVLARVNNAGVLSELFGAILLIVLLWVFAQRRPEEVLMAGTGGEGGSALGALLAPRSRPRTSCPVSALQDCSRKKPRIRGEGHRAPSCRRLPRRVSLGSSCSSVR